MNQWLAVEAALTPDERTAIKRRTVARNPSMAGASVADILEITADVDGFLEWTEPFYDDDGVRGALPAKLLTTPSYFTTVVLAQAMLNSRTPTNLEVAELCGRVFMQLTKAASA
ncbi:MAG: hypothetical protein ACRDZY_00695 [Acidimicrobiales bacterium]